MELTFQQQLNKELLRSEKRRIFIVIFFFVFATLFRLIYVYFFSMEEATKEAQNLSAIWMFPGLIILFELFTLLILNRRLRNTAKKVPVGFQYLNTGLEVCLLSLVMLNVARQHPGFDVLKSPAIFVYFIFIILSTLRLHFGLSFFCGLLASSSYVLLSLFIYHRFDINDAGRAIILVLSGVAAGLVAKQIRSGINNSLKEADRRHKVENLFGQQISPEVAEKMLENDGRIESRRMQVTVMFIDIRNFTSFAAGRTPEEIVNYQNSFFAIVVGIISRYHGIVHQFLGDGCMATFGAPLPLDNASQKAVAAAMEILVQLETASSSGMIFPTRVGIGIHSGEAVTGNIGTDTRQQYSVTGNVVIMASRIEQLNKEFESQILVSEEVIQSIDSSSMSPKIYRDVAVKGFGERVSVYQVV
jgi:adenylate cyclase